MWTCERQEPRPGSLILLPRLDGEPVSFARILRLWRHDAGFRDFFTASLADTPFTTFTWETPALSWTTEEEDFECIVMNAPYLQNPPMPGAFADHFDTEKAMAVFLNDPKDATLVAPTAPADQTGLAQYASLGPFLRHAPRRSTNALWRAVSGAAEQAMSARPIWISTGGAGVAWLHVRLDNTPKYYRHHPYTRVERERS